MRRFQAWSCYAVLLILAGCGGPSDLGEVTGTVTLDGQPLANAIVTFKPKSNDATTVIGKTDENGVYMLQYSREFEGAKIGEYNVHISTLQEGDPDADPPIPAVEEKVPANYNTETELSATVEAGGNTLDFKLESGE